MGLLCCFPDPIDFDAEVNLFQFYLHRAVGKGAFGKVRVVEHKKSKKLYALKYIDKARCIKQKAIANIIQERRLLEEVDHPFIVNLRYAFQDDENCFFVLDLMLGGDLRFHLERRGTLGENVVRFWVAELSSALSYLHHQRIIHRDIKPDNILLDVMGHAHITDFNVAIHYSNSRQHTSVAGSLAYMAPEVCTRKGYSWQVDWWSLGVVAWELLFMKRPFEGRTAEALTNAIAKAPITVPEKGKEICSAEGIQALKQFLERNPQKRLGCRSLSKGMEDIRSNPWFQGLNWELVEAKDAQPPFTPDMKKANFDISHELDEFLMVDKPLTAQKRKANPDLEKMKPELRQMEEQFTTFDFTKPKRMTYYPHNQPITVSMPQGDADPDSGPHTMAQMHMQSQTNTVVAGFTTPGDQSRATSPVGGLNQPQDGMDRVYAQSQGDVPTTRGPSMPRPPDRALTRVKSAR